MHICDSSCNFMVFISCFRNLVQYTKWLGQVFSSHQCKWVHCSLHRLLQILYTLFMWFFPEMICDYKGGNSTKDSEVTAVEDISLYIYT